MTTRQKKIIPTLKKVIFQTRYKPELEFYKLLIPAAQEIEGFENWKTDRLSISLQNHAKFAQVSIHHNSFSFEQDNDDKDLAHKSIETILAKLPKSLNIGGYLRLGYREKYLVPVEMSFPELVKILDLKLFSQDDSLKKYLPPEIYDMQYVYDAMNGERKYHIRIGPVAKKEIPAHIQINENNLEPINRNKILFEINDNYPEVALFFDIDIFTSKSNIPIEQGHSFYIDAKNKIDDMINNLSKYLLV